MPRRSSPPPETLEDRWLREAQTARNLEAYAAEQAGELERAIELYEQNAREGFLGDWPYGRLSTLYLRRGAFDDAERILERAIEVLAVNSRRSRADRQAQVREFRRRLKLLRQERRRSG
jgi:tetratricopeptide (TPR) repeat protein